MASRKSVPAATRQIGRPRAIPIEVCGDVREAILETAAGLFETQGYTSTSTRSIATAVGLRQASLFHYFARKEDILTELLDRTLRLTLHAAKQISLEAYEADMALWMLVDLDVSNLCRGPHNLGALQLLPEIRGPQFEWFWRRRRQLMRVYAAQIARGQADGALLRTDSAATVDVIFGLAESVITAQRPFRRRSDTPGAIADAALRVCGVPESRIQRIRREVSLLDDW
jgi:AcrR family transcriptional regulator